jgi:tetrapyrrole methylase family protein/MazG family protein/ATP diphosphatase
MSIQRLLTIMTRLRDPEAGCPWDREQSFASIAPYTIEEAYEVADAIERGDLHDLKGELGDLLFQVVFHAQMAREQHAFEFDDVANAISDKLERRHPHVFGDAHIVTAQEQNVAWEQHKRTERAARDAHGSALDDVPIGMPALTRATKLGKRASSVGFDWPDINGVLDKIEEEVRELRGALKSDDPAEIKAELGDVLFSLANLGRHVRVDLEAALRQTNAKFERRFRYVEAGLRKQGKSPQEASLEEMDVLWNEAKQLEAQKIGE